MDTKVREIPGMAEEFAKFAHEMADYLHERATELGKVMTKVMSESGEEFGAKFGEENKFGSFFESNPRKAAFAFIGAAMFAYMMKSRGMNAFFETPETKSGETFKPKMTAKKKAA